MWSWKYRRVYHSVNANYGLVKIVRTGEPTFITEHGHLDRASKQKVVLQCESIMRRLFYKINFVIKIT